MTLNCREFWKIQKFANIFSSLKFQKTPEKMYLQLIMFHVINIWDSRVLKMRCTLRCTIKCIWHLSKILILSNSFEKEQNQENV